MTRGVIWMVNWGIALFLLGLYLYLMAGVPVSILSHAIHDDVLFIDLANQIGQGNWLGSYDNRTLAKGPVFSIWLAGLHNLGIPMYFGQSLLTGVAAGLVLLTFYKAKCSPWIALGGFALVLFNPVPYSAEELRVVREGIYVPLTVAAFALMFLIILERRPVVRLCFAIAFGLVMGIFWLTREEGVWIFPAVALASAIYFFRSKDARNQIVLAMSTTAIGGGVALIIVSIVAGLNLKHYGVYETVEFRQDEFLSAYGSLARVIPKEHIPYVAVPFETMERIATVSPAFAPLVAHLRAKPGSQIQRYGWLEDSCALYRTAECPKEYHRALFMWAFREAVALEGHYETAERARAFYAELTEQIDQACTDGRLQCLPYRATMVPPFEETFIFDTLRTFIHLLKFGVTCEGCRVDAAPSTGWTNSLEQLSTFVGGPVSPPVERLYISGRIASSKYIINPITVVSPTGLQHDTTLDQKPIDVTQGSAIAYHLTTTCNVDGCGMEITAAGLTPVTIPLNVVDGILSVGDDEFRFTIDRLLSTGGDFAVAAKGWDVELKKIAQVYRFVLPYLTVAAAVVFIAFPFITSTVSTTWLFALIVLAGYVSRLGLLAVLDTVAIPSINMLYMSPSYPLLMLFIALSLSLVTPLISDHLKSRRGDNAHNET